MKKHQITFTNIFQISLSIILIDQLTKQIAERFLTLGLKYNFIPYILDIRLVRNSGAAFSLLSQSTTLLSFVSLIVSILILIYIWTKPILSRAKALGIAFLLGGTIGNGIDRFLYGYVRDFLEISFINFPVFNIADIAINIAFISLLIDTIKKRNKDI